MMMIYGGETGFSVRYSGTHGQYKPAAVVLSCQKTAEIGNDRLPD
jgi:hypothetical protein